VLALYLLMAVGRLHQIVPGLAAIRPALVTSALAIVLYLMDRRRSRTLDRTMRLPSSRYVIALLVWMSFTVPGALWPGEAFHVLVNVFLKVVITYLLVVGSVRGPRDVERLMGAYFLGVAVYAAAVLGQMGAGTDPWEVGRMDYYDSNDFATLAVTAIPMGLYLAATRRPLAERVVGALGLGPILVAFALSGSRGGFLALVSVGVFILVRMSAIPVRWRLLGALAVAVSFAVTVGEEYWEEIRAIPSQKDYNYHGEEGRLQIWRRAAGYVSERPVLGVGAGNFPVAEGTLSPLAERGRAGLPVKWSAAHNSYVQIGTELGLPGLLMFVGLLWGAFTALRRVRRFAARTRAPPALGETLAASLVGFLVGAFFLSLAYHEMLYTLLGLVAATAKVFRPGTAWLS
jgi:O-antigen ligase